MTDLYLIFFIVGLVLFALIVLYSYLQQKASRRARKQPDQPVNSTFKAGQRGASAEDADIADVSLRQRGSKTPVPTDPGSEVMTAVERTSTPEPTSEKKPTIERKIEPSLDSSLKPRADVSSTREVKRQRHQAETTQAETTQVESVKDQQLMSERVSAENLSVEKTPDQKGPSRLSRARTALSGIASSAAKSSKKAPSKAFQKSPAANSTGPHTSATQAEVAGNTPSKTAPKLDIDVASTPADAGQTFRILSRGNAVITDLVAKVLNPGPIEQSDLLTLFREHDYKFHRKVNIYGLNELTDMWRDIEFELPSARFLELGISIQLCDREGAMSERELHDFQQMVLQFCERYDAPFDFSIEIDAALKQAHALDQIARRYDSMAVLNVVPKSKTGFRLADIQSCARDLMMSTDKNGIFMKTEGQKNNITVLYRLACTDGEGHFGIQASNQAMNMPVHDLVVYMNVPATQDPEAVFQQMVKDANELATWLDGKVVDRVGKPMTQRTYSTLMQQISDIAYSMQQEGLNPGDAVARKIF